MKNYLEKFKILGPVDPKETTKILIDKAISPGKANIKKIAIDIIYLIFEKSDKVLFFEALVESMNHKTQKVSN